MKLNVPKHSCKGRGGLPRAFVRAMHRDYAAGASLAAVGRTFGGRTAGAVRDIFRNHGLPTRPDGRRKYSRFGPEGQFLPAPPATPAQITAAIARLTRLKIPPELKNDWAKWSFARRAAFVRRLWKKFDGPRRMPATPFSKNVTPFDYTTPAAWVIARKLNAGTNSRMARLKIKLASRGVIWREQLWFWCGRPNWGAYQDGPFRPVYGRQSLHRVIWETAHRRPVPAGQTVIHLDGNKNNLDPNNLGLRSMADCARMNQAFLRLERDPRNPRLLALTEKIMAAIARSRVARARARTGAALAQFQSGGPSLAAQLATL